MEGGVGGVGGAIFERGGGGGGGEEGAGRRRMEEEEKRDPGIVESRGCGGLPRREGGPLKL